jgi:hypothetical protein
MNETLSRSCPYKKEKNLVQLFNKYKSEKSKMIGNMILMLFFLEAILFMPKVSGVNLAYFKMYDMENVDGEKPALQFNKSEPHLSSDFQRIMANTHQICTNGL